ncbi:hypothetical protein [Macrococcus brunensis]|uniref:hypothetical protein n=1 Tax=Macrococcus brunensis TaxID=198483 RepID=UPI001EF13B79|nr:hypothetical protein [Macrococcus brunensis]ULG71753.1 hypothetical protein MGG12_10745 [Macrococcus brunensis]
MDSIERKYEIFDRLGQRWTCSIFKNKEYRNAPSFMRIRCRSAGFDKILDSLNNEHTLLKVLHFITVYNETERMDSYHMKSDYVMNIDRQIDEH